MKKESNLLREKAEKYKIPKHRMENEGVYSVESEDEVHYMSEEEFMEKAPDNKIWELHHGELIIHSPVGYVHKSLDVFLTTIVFAYVNAKGLGAVYNSPAAIKFDKDVIYEPDVFFVKKGNKGKIEKYLFCGVPDLIVEVVSPGHELYDRRTKFVNYERYGVCEYWILDPQNKKYNFYINKNGRFEEQGLTSKSVEQGFSLTKEEAKTGIYKSKEIEGFYLRLKWLENEKYWSNRNVNKIIYELIGKKNIIEDIGKKEIIETIGKKDVIETIGEEEIIDTIGEERLLDLIKKRKKSKETKRI